MAKTNDEKYAYVIAALGELLEKKDDSIEILEWDVKNLRERLEKAEAERDELLKLKEEKEW